MNIAEAAKIASDTDGFICRKSDCNFIKIKPTNSPDCCVVYINGGKRSFVRWNPDLADLTSDDWMVFDKVDNWEMLKRW